jgi:hypothetical protein
VHGSLSDLSYDALKKLSCALPVKCPQGEFRIFNSLSKPVTGPFEIESWMHYKAGAPFKDSTGRTLPIQHVTGSVNCANRRWLFVDTIPARTMKSYYFDSEAAPVETDMEEYRFQAGSEIEAGQFRVASPGVLADAALGAQLLRGALRLGVIPDDSDTWSHGLAGYGDAQRYFDEVCVSAAAGPVASRLLSRQECGKSSAELLFTVYEDLPFVDLSVYVRWNEERSILKLELEPISMPDVLLVQGPGGCIEKRTVRVEEPLHGWIAAGGVAIAQDGAFAFDRLPGSIRITLVRSSLYGYDKGWKLDPLGPLYNTDMGEHSFRLRFFFGDNQSAQEMDRRHAALVEPFAVIRDNK